MTSQTIKTFQIGTITQADMIRFANNYGFYVSGYEWEDYDRAEVYIGRYLPDLCDESEAARISEGGITIGDMIRFANNYGAYCCDFSGYLAAQYLETIIGMFKKK